MKNFLLVLIIISITLYATNPSKYEFKEYAEEYVKNEVRSSGITSNSFIDNLIALVSGKASSLAVDYLVERDDYYLFSVYQIKGIDIDYSFIGIFKKFIAIKNSINMNAINYKFRDEITLFDNSIVIEEDHYRVFSFDLQNSAEITIEGQLTAGPEIEIFLFNEEGFISWENLMKLDYLELLMNPSYLKSVSYHTGLSQMGGRSIYQTSMLSPGKYYFVFDNTDLGSITPPFNFADDTCQIDIKIISK